MPDVTQRMNYFDRQFLRADDFQDEQAYHLDRRRRHNAGFHGPGVVEGLLVSPGGQADTVTVARGWAVDAQGREIVLATPRSDVPTGGVNVEVWISYRDPEPLNTPVTEAGTSGSTRVLEEPVVTVVPPGTVPANALRLATVAGGTIDNSVRLLAGLKNNAVIEANLADNAVSSRALAEAEAGTTQDANSGTGVKTAHLKDRAVTEPKLADNAVSNRVVLNGAINEPKLANNAVSAAKLRADASVDANRAVGPNHIQSNAVSSRAIAVADPGNDQNVNTGAGVKTGHLKDEAITTAKLANGAVTGAKLDSLARNGLVAGFCAYDGPNSRLLNHHNVVAVSKHGPGHYTVTWSEQMSPDGPILAFAYLPVQVLDPQFFVTRIVKVTATSVELTTHDLAALQPPTRDAFVNVLAFRATGEQ